MTIKSTLSNLTANRSKGIIIAAILFTALVGFEMFNFDTTRYALRDVLGDLTFAGLEWAGILAFAFCGIDFAGLIRLFTTEQGEDEPKEVWLLTGAWLLGATMNALMTWYAVVLAIGSRPLASVQIDQTVLATAVPIFIAALVWLTRLLFIGSLSVAGERLLHTAKPTQPKVRPTAKPVHRPRRERPTVATATPIPELNGLFKPHEGEPS